jgi:hypothetical protein
MSEILSLFERHCENLKGRGNQRIALCPFHDDTKHSFSINIDRGLYNCKSCGVSGNAVKFAKAFDDDPKPFYSDDYKSPIKNRYKSVRTNGEQTKKPILNGGKTEDTVVKTTHNNAPVKQERNRNESADKPRVRTKEWWERIRKYQKEWHNGLGYYNINCVGEDQGHLVFPYFDADGKVPIGIKHHKPSFWESGSDGKLKFYNEWHIPHMDKSQPLLIVEGEKDALTMMNLGHNAVSGSGGCDAVPKIPQSFKQFNVIKILYDNDVYGRQGAEKMAKEIYQQIGIIARICEWGEGVPNKYDVTDVMENMK